MESGVVLKRLKRRPAKGVGRATGARVQIPPAPLTERKRQSESSGCLFLLYDIMSVREGNMPTYSSRAANDYHEQSS